LASFSVRRLGRAICTVFSISACAAYTAITTTTASAIGASCTAACAS
jgi:hypothetical protein